MPDDLPWRQTDTGAIVRIRLTPKASRDAVVGMEDTGDGLALKVAVRALPHAGAANAALTRLVSKWLGMPKAGVTLLRGGKSRIKTLKLSGDPGELSARLEERTAQWPAPKTD